MRLTDLIGKSKANRLVILGDFWHAPQGVTDSVIQEITDWREQHASMKIDLILGNHDRRSPIPDSWNIEVYTESLHESPFVFDHYPEVDPRGYTLAGHLHPSTVLRGRGRQTLKLACFWFRDEFAVLPAFGSFTGTATIERTREDRVFAIAENEVIEIP
jgi:DNA ligase-associated metallophosphoesterase